MCLTPVDGMKEKPSDGLYWCLPQYWRTGAKNPLDWAQWDHAVRFRRQWSSTIDLGSREIDWNLVVSRTAVDEVAAKADVVEYRVVV